MKSRTIVSIQARTAHFSKTDPCPGVDKFLAVSLAGDCTHHAAATCAPVH